MRWEYKVVRFKKGSFMTGQLDMQELEQQLNELGREGWELVSIAPVGLHRFSRELAVALKRQR
ncbi:MAG TPA: DUF4177 domain-containing protein [Hyphomicrobiales bacterium]|nr:DUF4177 domain-containing protein [Hyphomicrobiales bacterium]